MKLLLPVWLLPLMLMACTVEQAPPSGHGMAQSAEEYERGPQRGRLLRDGDFSLEITVYETHVPPQFRLYAYENGKPLPASTVVPSIRIKRLDGEINDFTFSPEGNSLIGSGTVTEPHSFDVEVTATHAGKTYNWAYSSYEGRTTIDAVAATEAGVGISAAGPAVIRDTVRLMGQVVVNANRYAEVKARFPGVVRQVHVQQGESVKRGQTLVTVEGNDSMRLYAVPAPFDGVVLSRSTSVGDIAGSNTLVTLANLSELWVELRAFGMDAERLAVGQPVRIQSATGDATIDGSIQSIAPLAMGQSLLARVSIPNTQGRWRPGMAVSAGVTVASRTVPLAVKESGLQRFRDFTVVFAQVGDTYEVRMLELGARDGEYVEVLSGIKPGTPYVSEQSFLIKADIEKTGASHDH